MGMIEELLQDNRCCVCKKPLSINNCSGYCKKHYYGKERYNVDEKYRQRKLAYNRQYYQRHKEKLLVIKAKKYALAKET